MGSESKVRTLVPNFNLLALKCGLTAPKSQKLLFLVKICPKGVYPLNRFLPNLVWERDSQVCTRTPIFSLWL